MERIHIGYLLKTWRLLEKKNVRIAAKELDISPATLSRIENGKPMEQKTIIKLINLLFRGDV